MSTAKRISFVFSIGLAWKWRASLSRVFAWLWGWVDLFDHDVHQLSAESRLHWGADGRPHFHSDSSGVTVTESHPRDEE